MAVAQQCRLAGVSRATVYARQKPKPVDERELLFSRLIDEEYTRHPFYGSRKMVVFLKAAGSSPIVAVDWRAGCVFDGGCMAAGEVGLQLVV